MRKFSALIILCTLVALLISAQVPARTGPAVQAASHASSVTVDVSFDGLFPSIVEANGAKAVRLEGCLAGFAPGYPDIPVYLLRVEIPLNARVESVEVVAGETMELDGTFDIAPTPVPLSTDSQGRVPRSVEPTFDEKEWYPISPAASKGEGFLRNHKIASVAVYPVAYRQTDGKLKFLRKATIIVHLAADVDGSIERKRTVARSEREFEENVLGRLVANPTKASGPRPSLASTEVKEPFAPSFRPSLDGSPVEYVIITNETMQPEFQRLADWKTKSGVAAVARTVSWVRQNYPEGCDLQETLRRFIKDAYSSWGTTYVLLAGDSDVIPPRYGWSTYTGGEEIPTDLYYQCLDGNWNGDGDYYFGEGWLGQSLPGDLSDLYPEVWIGRAPVNTLAEAQLFVNKTLGYLKNPPTNFVTNALFFAEVLFPKDFTPSGIQCDTVALDGASLAESALSFMPPSFRKVKLYENRLCFPGSFPETKQAVWDSLNVGYGVAEHVGHGYRNTLSVADATLVNGDIDLLTNGNRVGVLIAENCTSAAFDFNCIGERFILNPNGGSVCYVGSTRYDYPTTAWVFQDEFFRLLFQERMTNIGMAHALSKTPFIPLCATDDSYRWTQFVLILLGDPHMPVWLNEPGTLNVAYAPQMVAGEPYFDVTVTSQGSPVDSAVVCLLKVNEDYKVAYTDVSGLARVPFEPDTQGQFSVTVTKQDCLPFEGTATVVPPAAPYMRKYADSVDDDAVAPSFGNGDGKVDAGETVEFSLLIRNSGTAAAQGVHAVVRTNDSFLTFVDSSANYGNVNPNSSAFPDVPYLLEVSRSCPDQHDAICTIEIRDSADSVWTDVFLVRVRAAVLWHAGHTVVDTIGGGNGNGEIDPGEVIELPVTLRNVGSGYAGQVRAYLRTFDPNISITDSVAVFGDMPACSSRTGDTFVFTCTDYEDHHFYLAVVDTTGLNQVTHFELTIPATPYGLFAVGSSSSIKLRWDANPEPDLHGYNVYRSSSESGPYVRANDRVVERISYFIDDGLEPYSRYYYKAAAQDSSGNESPLCSPVSVTTNPPLHVNSPVELGEQLTPASPIVVDLDRNGDLEIIAASSRMYAFKHDGTEYIDGDNDVLTSGVFAPQGEKFSASPTVADLDRDGVTEVVAVDWNQRKVYVWNADGTLEAGWPQTVGINPWSTPAVGDIDGDSDLEIVVGNADGKVYAWHHNGVEVRDGDGNPSTLGVFAVTGSMWLYGSAAMADIDSDGIVEIIIGGRDGKLYAWNGDGTAVPKFPYVVGGYITSSPAVADIDDDMQPEIVFSAATYKVYAINLDSTSVPGWPKSGVVLNGDMQPSPAIGDIDGDSKLDVVAAGSNGYVYAWKGYNGQL
ncbi:MAG: C25 family cysteine peptidase, partial [Candidatus Eisenbacteria bacterium]